MKYLILPTIILTAITVCISGETQPTGSGCERRDDVDAIGPFKLLEESQCFRVGGVREGGEPSPEEMALYGIIEMEQDNASKVFEKLYSTGSPAGKLYALLGLRLIDMAKYEKLVPELKRNTNMVDTQAGRVISKQTVQAIVESMEAGDYDIDRDGLKAIERDLKSGADINSPNEYGLPPLHVATMQLNRELVKKLIEKGANVNAVSTSPAEEGLTALHYAARRQNDYSSYDPDAYGIAKLLLQHGANPNIKAMERWIKTENVTPLTFAYDANNKRMVDLLLSYGAEVNVSGGGSTGISLFHLAVKRCDVEMIKTLVAHHADITVKQENDETPFDFAIHYGSKEIVKMLIANYPEAVNARNEKKWGETPLFIAAGSGRAEIVELLLENGADANAGGRGGVTALYRAQNKEIAELLISKGLDVNARRTDTGDTPLHTAAQALNAEVVRCLIAHGADVNARDKVGRTPLHSVALNWDKEVAEILVAHGADIYARDRQGKSFVSMARGSREREGEPRRRLEETLAFLDELEKKARGNKQH